MKKYLLVVLVVLIVFLGQSSLFSKTHLSEIKSEKKYLLQHLTHLKRFRKEPDMLVPPGFQFQNGSQVLLSKYKNSEHSSTLILNKSDPLLLQYKADSGFSMKVQHSKKGSFNYYLIFSDRITLTVQDNLFYFSYPDKRLNYYDYFVKGEPKLFLSPALAGAIFYNDNSKYKRSLLINNIVKDFPYRYETLILDSADREQIVFENQRDLSIYIANWFRDLAKLQNLEWSEELFLASKNHSKYILRQGELKAYTKKGSIGNNYDHFLSFHNEKKENPDFTGRTPEERYRKTGYRYRAAETGALLTTDLITDFTSWFWSVYHRRFMIHPHTVQLGSVHLRKNSLSRESVGFALWGQKGSKKKFFKIFPADNEQYVPVSWSGVEAPAPYPGEDTPLGVIITVTTNDKLMQNGKLSLFEVDEDSKLKELQLIFLKRKELKPLFLEAISKKPLKYDTKYRITYQAGDLLEVSNFKTRAETPLHKEFRELNRIYFEFEN